MGERPTSWDSSPSPPPPPPIPEFARTPTPLPYEVLFSEAPEDLPTQPLPSIEDIEQSSDIAQNLPWRHTCRVGQSFVVTWGTNVEPVEGHNLRFVQEHADISVPQLFAIYQRPISPQETMTYIIMECIQGETLDQLWDGLEVARKKDIAEQLRKAISSLREIPDPGYFGSIRESKFQDMLFWTQEPAPEINGPFMSEDELFEGIIAKYIYECEDAMKSKADHYRRVLPKILRGSGQPVFTHNDLKRKNVIVCPDGSIVLLSWARSGWYPTYWEYATTMWAERQLVDDWHVYIGEILEEFPNQYIWLLYIRLGMWS
jgi:hypothetical protein